MRSRTEQNARGHGTEERGNALKAESRARDAQALASGRLTAEQINRGNGVFSGRDVRIDFSRVVRYR